MRILFDYTPYDPKTPTGAGRIASNLLLALANQDKSNSITAIGFAKPPEKISEYTNVKYVQIDNRLRINRLSKEISRTLSILKLTRRIKYDVVHMNLEPALKLFQSPVNILTLYDINRHYNIDMKLNKRDRLWYIARTKLRYQFAKRADTRLVIFASVVDIPLNQGRSANQITQSICF